jgi:two-component system, NtrC family, response regulator AtoC
MAASVGALQHRDSDSGKSKPGRRKILLIEDDTALQQYVETILDRSKFTITAFSTAAEGIENLQAVRPDLILLDLFMQDTDGIEVLRQIKQVAPTVKVIALSCCHDSRYSVEALRAGARDVLLKPFHREELFQVVQTAIGPANNADDSQHIRLDEQNMFVFASQSMRDIRHQCSLVARVDIPVLILGESGTGKEVLAKYLHKTSPRANRMFLKVNCAAMPGDLLESELFGYEQGAFTGANRAKPGKFEMCNGGTIFLDEIGELPFSLQAKLLHVLQDGVFSRLGARSTSKVDVRVLAATNIDMKQAIAQKSFREDLFYRLNGFTLTLPPLRKRKEEIPIVIQYFITRLADGFGREVPAVSDRLLQACMDYDWPGNLRELENFVKRFIILGNEDLMISELAAGSPLRAESKRASALDVPEPDDLKRMVRGLKADAELEAIARILEKTNWNRKKASTELNISYKALLYKIKQYGIQPPKDTGTPSQP